MDWMSMSQAPFSWTIVNVSCSVDVPPDFLTNVIVARTVLPAPALIPEACTAENCE
jgi:hypothetical protein